MKRTLLYCCPAAFLALTLGAVPAPAVEKEAAPPPPLQQPVPPADAPKPVPPAGDPKPVPPAGDPKPVPPHLRRDRSAGPARPDLRRAPAPERRGAPERAPRFAGLPPMPPMMSEDDAAKFAELNADVLDALGDYYDGATDSACEHLETCVGALVDARLKFEVDRAEKALERAKAALKQRDKLVERQLKLLLRGDRAGQHERMAPAPEARRAPAEMRQERRRFEAILFTEDEGIELLTLRNELRKLDPGSEEAKKTVGELAELFRKSLVHVRADLEKAKAENRPTADFERAEAFLTRQLEQCSDPVKYAERTRRGPNRGNRPGEKRP